MRSRTERPFTWIGTPRAATSPFLATIAPAASAITIAATFVALVLPYLDTLAHDPDEAWLMLDARFIARGFRPFVDFPHHEMPLHLYILAVAGKVFGATLFGYRMASLLAVAASGVALFAFAKPFAGALPALAAEVVFLFSSTQMRAVTGVPETPAVLFTLIGALCLFVGRGRASACAGGVAFVLALMTKPTALAMVLSAVASLATARDWRRLGYLAISGVVAAVVALVSANYVSEGVFGEILRFQIARVGTRSEGMWTIDSGFRDMVQLTGITSPWQFAWSSFKTFYQVGIDLEPTIVVALSLLALPAWVFGCARTRPAVRTFMVLWPLAYLLVNFAALDFVTPRYFIPFPAFSAMLIAGLVWLAQRRVPSAAIAAILIALTVGLGTSFASSLQDNRDLWYRGRLDWIARTYPSIVAFSPMFFAATGAEPGCGLANPALTYGAFGEKFLVTPRTRGFRFSDERLIQCLRANPTTPVIVDWSFYFFTRPGSPLRTYLAGEGSEQRLFFSPDAVEQWHRPLLRMHPYR